MRSSLTEHEREGSVIVNIGPSHPATHGTVQIIAELKDRGYFPVKLELDISPLDIGDVLHVSDVKLPGGVKAVTAGREAVISMVAPEKETAVEAAPEGSVYVCPMHPEVRQDHPGSCPECGMPLEPELPSLDDEANPELVDFQRRFVWTLPLTVVVAGVAMFGHALGVMEMATQSWVELALSLPVAKAQS